MQELRTRIGRDAEMGGKASALLPVQTVLDIAVMAGSHRDLECWKLADELRQKVLAIFKRPNVSRDKPFCDDIDRSTNSACHNMAEGFYKFKHKPFAASLRIARGELGEARDQLDSAARKKYITREEHKELDELCRRALAATGGLIRWLETHPDP